MNFISSIAWVSRGIAKEIPDEVKLDAAEIQKLFLESKNENPGDGDDNESLGDENGEKEESEWATDEENTDNEDDKTGETDGAEDVQDEDDADPADPSDSKGPNFSVSSISYFSSNDEDPYVAVKDKDETSSEDEDYRIRPDDNLLAVAHVDEDANVLEVWVYNEENDDLYCHHDTILPSYPLALEWLSFNPASNEERGSNLVAVGSMDSVIQVWDLDVVNAVEPIFELRSKQKKRKRSDKMITSGHSDAVLALAWNPVMEHVFASGSADATVVLWDLEEQRPATTISSFEDKVQAVRWRPGKADQILCGSCDKKVRLFDCRLLTPTETAWIVEGEVERLAWSPADDNLFYVGTDSGHLSTFDVRQTKEALCTVQAHGKGITGLTVSPKFPSVLLTTSEDKRVKVWDVADHSAIDLVFEQKFKMGELQYAGFSPDSPFVVALGGEDTENNLRVVDLYKLSEEVQQRWDDKLPSELKAKYQPVKQEDGARVAKAKAKKFSKENGDRRKQSSEPPKKEKDKVGKGERPDKRKLPESNKEGTSREAIPEKPKQNVSGDSKPQKKDKKRKGKAKQKYPQFQS